jgi:hypothetical protein
MLVRGAPDGKHQDACGISLSAGMAGKVGRLASMWSQDRADQELIRRLDTERDTLIAEIQDQVRRDNGLT